MKRILPYKFILPLAVMMMVAGNSRSQDTVAVDTVTVVSDENTAPPEEPVDEEDYYYPDSLKRIYRSVAGDTIQAINNDKGFYYRRYMDSLLRATEFNKPQQARRTGSFNLFDSIVGVIFWIVAIALFGFLVYRLFLSNGSFFSRSRRNISNDSTVAIEENANDPEWHLQEAIKNGNYRLAVRYLYLLCLKRLADKNYIEINSNKTNYEYVSEVRKQRFANEFASLTLQYEYVWYGDYPVDQKLFEQIHAGFNHFHKNYTR